MDANATTRPDAPGLRLRVADLPKSRDTGFDIRPDADWCADIARDLGIDGLRKLRFQGRLIPQGTADWRLEAHLGATVIQPCIVTLTPVTTRLEEDTGRTYLANPPEIPEAAEVEMPEDDSQEALPAVIDLAQVMTEALALALPLYPRADGAELDQTQFAAPGVAPMTDEEARPFAGLKALRDKLEDGE